MNCQAVYIRTRSKEKPFSRAFQRAQARPGLVPRSAFPLYQIFVSSSLWPLSAERYYGFSSESYMFLQCVFALISEIFRRIRSAVFEWHLVTVWKPSAPVTPASASKKMPPLEPGLESVSFKQDKMPSASLSKVECINSFCLNVFHRGARGVPPRSGESLV